MDFTDAESAVKAEIKAKLPYVKTVETYAGQLEEDVEQMTLLFPAIFVVFSGMKLEKLDNMNYGTEPEFRIIVVAKGLKGNEALRTGEHGAYQMVKDVLAAITNNRFGLDAMEPMKPVKIGLIFVSKKVAAYGIDFTTNFDTAFKEA